MISMTRSHTAKSAYPDRGGARLRPLSTALPIALPIAVLLLAGCSQLPTTHYYVLEIAPPAAAPAAAAPLAISAPAAAASSAEGSDAAASWSIGVRPFAVDAPYDQERIVYRIGERSPEVGFYAYHLWAAPLSSMLSAAVASGLGGAEGVSSLEPVVPGRRYDAFLLGRVLAVEEIDLADRQEVRVAIELRLHAPDGAELWSEALRARGETRTGEVAAIVEALGSALADALHATRGSLERAIATLAR